MDNPAVIFNKDIEDLDYLRENLSQAEKIDEYHRQPCLSGCSSNQIFWLFFLGLIILAIGGLIYRNRIQK